MAQVDVVYSGDVLPATQDELDPKMRQMAAQLSRWVDNARAATNRSSMFDRGAYVAPDNQYRQMSIARTAVQNDDIVGGIAELTESLAFQGIKWESSEPDEADVFNQISAEIDMDALVRKMYRETFTYSQVCVGFWWGQGTFKVRGKTKKGNQRKLSYDVWYPKAITTLDSLKIVPVGMMAFGQESLAWQATPQEISQYYSVMDGTLMDELMERFYSGQYMVADPYELQELTALGVDVSRLVLLNPDLVKRHSQTKPDHLRFPDIRLKRVFKLLDLKQQLMEADRVNLIGAANYILLVKKGSKEDPAYPEEIANLQENFDYVAKLPVIISDHRLEIEIITPKQDFTLSPEKYDVLDNRITQAVLGLFAASGSRSGNRGDNSLQQGRLVARGLENKRHMLRRFLEREIAKAIVEHPRNAGVFKDQPNLAFVPSHVALDDDTGWAQSIISLRTMNELSRESVLEYFGFDQAVEAMRRDLEADSGLDDIFQTMVPFSANGGGGGTGAASGAPPVAQGAAGARGGRPAGGGTPTKNVTKAPAASASGQQSTKGKTS
jgi:hypothetical protein